MEKFTLFYGGPFSQWARCTFEIEGVTYGCAEQWMMQQKALFCGDHEAAKEIMKTSHPRDQKAIGRRVKGFVKDKWEAVARDVVYKGNWHKFKQNPGFYLSMKESKGTILVEASPTDVLWGVGLAEDDPRALDRSQWRGKNWLGEVLNKVRDDIEQGIYRTEGFNWSK